MPVARPNDMLLEIEAAERKGREKVIQSYAKNFLDQRYISKAVDDKRLRASTEILLNGCTDFRSARFLQLEGLAKSVDLRSRSDHFREKIFSAIELTDLGQTWVLAQHEGREDERYYSIFEGAILGYVCMDAGEGICATREFMETAADLPDPEILERIVHPVSGEHMFPNAHSMKNRITDDQRAKTARWWSIDPRAPRKARVIDLMDLTLGLDRT